jgi:tetratricopeptide (TPR) repeat protein
MATNTFTKTNNTTAAYGENSASVLQLQKDLNKKYGGQSGYVPLVEDGKYGDKTLAATKFAPLDPSKAPTTTSDVVQTSKVNIPTTTPPSGNITNAFATAAKNGKFYEVVSQQSADDAAALQKQIDAVPNSDTGKAQTSFLQKILGSKTPGEVRSETLDEIGINPKQYFANQQAALEEIKALSTDYNASVARRDKQIATIEDNSVGGWGDYVSEEVARVTRNAAIDLNQKSANINTKTAIMESERGNFKEAMDFVNQAVDDATADLKYNVDMFNTFYNVNKDAIDRLDGKYKDAIKNARDYAEQSYIEKRKAEEKRISSQVLGVDPFVLDVMQEQIDAGGTAEAAAQAAVDQAEALGVQVDYDLAQKFYERAKTLGKTPVTSTAETTAASSKSKSGFTNSGDFQTRLKNLKDAGAFNVSGDIKKLNDTTDLESTQSFFSNLFGG